MKKVFLLFLSILIYVKVFSQNSGYRYKPLPGTYSQTEVVEQNFRQIIADSFLNAYDLTKCLPKGYLENASVDYTKYIQEGINNHDKVIFPNFSVLVDAKGILLHSNSQIYFPKNASIVMLPNNLPSYHILNINGASNIAIYFPHLIGDRDLHYGNIGEWGHGINISNSYDIKIYYAKISKCWGDGIYIRNTSDKNHGTMLKNQNIKIDHAFIDDIRRNGISVTSVNGLTIDSAIISNCHGINPQSGLDVEPNGIGAQLTNVSINNLITYNNAACGVIFSFKAMLSNKSKNVFISIKNHLDLNSYIAEDLILSNKTHSNFVKLSGQINIIDPLWIDNQYKPVNVYSGCRENGINVKIVNPKIEHRSLKGTVSNSILQMHSEILNDSNINIVD